MGRDKAFVEVDGVAMAARVGDALRQAGASEVVAVGGEATRLEALGFVVVADDTPGAGPLGGILTAFAAVRTEVVVVLACDLPGADPGAVTAVVAALTAEPAAAVAWPEADGSAHVLHAAWRTSLAQAPLAAAFAAGQRSVRAASGDLDVVVVRDVPTHALVNANRPEDLVPRPRPPRMDGP